MKLLALIATTHALSTPTRLPALASAYVKLSC